MPETTKPETTKPTKPTKLYVKPMLRKLGRLGVLVQGRVGSKPEGVGYTRSK